VVNALVRFFEYRRHHGSAKNARELVEKVARQLVPFPSVGGTITVQEAEAAWKAFEAADPLHELPIGNWQSQHGSYTIAMEAGLPTYSEVMRNSRLQGSLSRVGSWWQAKVYVENPEEAPEGLTLSPIGYFRVRLDSRGHGPCGQQQAVNQVLCFEGDTEFREPHEEDWAEASLVFSTRQPLGAADCSSVAGQACPAQGQSPVDPASVPLPDETDTWDLPSEAPQAACPQQSTGSNSATKAEASVPPVQPQAADRPNRPSWMEVLGDSRGLASRPTVQPRASASAARDSSSADASAASMGLPVAGDRPVPASSRQAASAYPSSGEGRRHPLEPKETSSDDGTIKRLVHFLLAKPGEFAKRERLLRKYAASGMPVEGANLVVKPADMEAAVAKAVSELATTGSADVVESSNAAEIREGKSSANRWNQASRARAIESFAGDASAGKGMTVGQPHTLQVETSKESNYQPVVRQGPYPGGDAAGVASPASYQSGAAAQPFAGVSENNESPTKNSDISEKLGDAPSRQSASTRGVEMARDSMDVDRLVAYLRQAKDVEQGKKILLHKQSGVPEDLVLAAIDQFEMESLKRYQ